MNSCKFCNKECTIKKDYFVCEECKTVCFSQKATNIDIPQTILDYLNNAQAQIKDINKHGFLHQIDQKELNGEKLTQEEQTIYEVMDKFHALGVYLKVILKNDISLDSKNTRNKLYELLDLSDKLESTLSTFQNSKQN